MNTNLDNQPRVTTSRIALVLTCALVLAACATTTTPHSTSRIEIQDEVGFTITEDARIGGDVRTDYEAALGLLEQGRHEQGIELLQEVAGEAPQLSAPRIDLGIAYHRAGDLDAAEKSLLQALALSPGHPVVHNELGIVYRKKGRFAEARARYEAALAIYPNYHYARRNLAILCDLYLADLHCALDNYEAYMRTVPGDDEATMWIADIRTRIGQ
jgi:Flp pilus assembly protein TadD